MEAAAFQLAKVKPVSQTNPLCFSRQPLHKSSPIPADQSCFDALHTKIPTVSLTFCKIPLPLAFEKACAYTYVFDIF